MRLACVYQRPSPVPPCGKCAKYISLMRDRRARVLSGACRSWKIHQVRDGSRSPASDRILLGRSHPHVLAAGHDRALLFVPCSAGFSRASCIMPRRAAILTRRVRLVYSRTLCLRQHPYECECSRAEQSMRVFYARSFVLARSRRDLCSLVQHRAYILLNR